MAITTNNPISKQTVGSAGAASVTFSNIPQTFTDLNLVFSARNSDATPVRDFRVQFNSDTAANYSNMEVYGISGSAGSGSNTTNQIQGACNADTSTASVFTNISLYVPNYASSNYKSISIDNATENNSTSDAQLRLIASKWSNTAAITSIQITTNSGNYMQYSTFSLYGISSNTTTQNTSVPSATGGDVITTDGTYWYHAFKYSGTFTPLKALTADCLVVAGGGGSGYAYGAGGGAGGLLYNATTAFANSTAHTMTIGAGGTNGTNASRYGISGSNSTITATGFTTLTAVGGGGGGADFANSHVGKDGGSGGGASGGGGVNYSGGTATSGQGYDGGAIVSANTGGSGGGGAGAVGAQVTGNQVGGNGGVGSSAYSSWGSATITGELVSSTRYYAGGGGGSSGDGGSGGGGWGANYAGTATIPNTGGGGGGDKGSGGGGSGIVIVRYAV